MAAKTEGSLGLKYGWGRGFSGWDEDNDGNLKKIGAVAQLAVESTIVTSEPGVFVLGHRYLLPESGCTGIFTGHDGKIAVAVNNDWEFHVVQPGWRIWDKRTCRMLVRDDVGYQMLGGGKIYENPSSALTVPIDVGLVLCDTTLNSQNITLPLDPVDQMEIKLVKVDTSENNISVLGNGRTVNGLSTVTFRVTGYSHIVVKYLAISDSWIAFVSYGRTEWTAVTYQNSWVDVVSEQPTQYRRYGEYVEIRGCAQNGTSGVVFTLPVGFRPINRVSFAIPVHDGASAPEYGHLAVETNGEVELEHPSSLSSHKIWFNLRFPI